MQKAEPNLFCLLIKFNILFLFFFVFHKGGFNCALGRGSILTRWTTLELNVCRIRNANRNISAKRWRCVVLGSFLGLRDDQCRQGSQGLNNWNEPPFLSKSASLVVTLVGANITHLPKAEFFSRIQINKRGHRDITITSMVQWKGNKGEKSLPSFLHATVFVTILYSFITTFIVSSRIYFLFIIFKDHEKRIVNHERSLKLSSSWCG